MFDPRVDYIIAEFKKFNQQFCKKAKCCLGISENGNPDLVLNQQGDWITSGGGNIQDLLSDLPNYINNEEGIADGKNVGFWYHNTTTNSVSQIVSPSYSFSAKFSAVSSLDLTGCFLDLIGNDCATLINWGDGTIDSNLTHTYSISGDYVISVVCDDAFEIYVLGNTITEFYYALPIGLQNLYLGDNQIVDFNPSIALPIGLQDLGLGNNHIVDFNPSIALPIGLQNLGLGDNQIVDFNPSIALPIGLQNLELSGNQIVDFNPSIALPIGLQILNLGSNQIVNFNPSIALPIGLQNLELSVNQMTIAGYTASETWANAQPSFTSSCNVYFTSNIDSVSGTNLETILISKNCTISA